MDKTVLVVDDDPADMKRMVNVLSREGYKVLEASNAEETLLKVHQALPGLVIIDVVLAGSETTGFDVCRKIKTTFQPKPPRVLLVTGKSAAVNVSLANQMGADGFEAKTSDMAQVVKAAKHLFLSANGG